MCGVVNKCDGGIYMWAGTIALPCPCSAEMVQGHSMLQLRLAPVSLTTYDPRQLSQGPVSAWLPDNEHYEVLCNCPRPGSRSCRQARRLHRWQTTLLCDGIFLPLWTLWTCHVYPRTPDSSEGSIPRATIWYMGIDPYVMFFEHQDWSLRTQS